MAVKTFETPNKIAADDTFIFLLLLSSEEIRLDVSCES